MEVFTQYQRPQIGQYTTGQREQIYLQGRSNGVAILGHKICSEVDRQRALKLLRLDRHTEEQTVEPGHHSMSKNPVQVALVG